MNAMLSRLNRARWYHIVQIVASCSAISSVITFVAIKGV